VLRDALSAGLRRAVERLAEDGTPFFLFDPGEIDRRAAAWRKAAAAVGPADVFYPYKCNRHPAVVRRLARAGLGAEVATRDDLRTARALGVAGTRIVVHGPAKTRDAIDAALAAGALLVADGAEDARAILARAKGVREPASLAAPSLARFFEARTAARSALRAGISSPSLAACAAIRALLPAGLAFHLGTGIPSTLPYRKALEQSAEVARELAASGISISQLDLGGGFAAQTESRLDGRLRPLGVGIAPEVLVEALGKEARRLFGPDVELLFEPGRAIVSQSFRLVARVLRVKESERRRTVFLDASRLSHAFFAGWGRHPIETIPRRRGPRRAATLAGPLGVGVDVFARSELLAPVRPGDLVVIGSVGAYNWNAVNGWAGATPAGAESESRDLDRPAAGEGARPLEPDPEAQPVPAAGQDELRVILDVGRPVLEELSEIVVGEAVLVASADGRDRIDVNLPSPFAVHENVQAVERVDLTEADVVRVQPRAEDRVGCEVVVEVDQVQEGAEDVHRPARILFPDELDLRELLVLGRCDVVAEAFQRDPELIQPVHDHSDRVAHRSSRERPAKWRKRLESKSISKLI
jgi:diaminopimelate decarboxylase